MRNKKNYIIHVIGADSTKYGGLEKFLIQLADELSQHNIETILIYNSYPKSKIYINALKAARVKVFVANALKPWSFFLEFSKICRQFKPVVVHSHFQPVFPILYSWLLGCKHRLYSVRLMLLDDHYKEIITVKLLNRKKRSYWFLLKKLTTLFIAVSNGVRNQITSVYPEIRNKTIVLYNSADENLFTKEASRQKYNFKNEYIYIGCTAFASVIKGIDVLIEALFLLKTIYKIRNIKLCLIGLDSELPYSKNILNLINKFNLDEQVIWFGIIDNVPEIIVATDIYCQPSRTESFGSAIVEAAMAGVPGIGANVGGVNEVIMHKETGLLFPPENSASLAEAINYLIKNYDMRKKMGQQAKLFAQKHFNRQKQIKQMLQIYLELMSNSR